MKRDLLLEVKNEEGYFKIHYDNERLINVSKQRNEEVNLVVFYDGKSIKEEKRKNSKEGNLCV